MREILFRGKRIDNGEWVKGYLIRPEFDKSRAYIGYLFPDDDHDLDVAEVASSTVGRFTGLTDRNCVKIFEGDIVRYGDTIHRVVFEQRNGTAYFGLVYAACETLPFGHYQDLKQIEVIGNIYDNPELLKDGEQNE